MAGGPHHIGLATQPSGSMIAKMAVIGGAGGAVNEEAQIGGTHRAIVVLSIRTTTVRLPASARTPHHKRHQPHPPPRNRRRCLRLRQ